MDFQIGVVLFQIGVVAGMTGGRRDAARAYATALRLLPSLSDASCNLLLLRGATHCPPPPVPPRAVYPPLGPSGSEGVGNRSVVASDDNHTFDGRVKQGGRQPLGPTPGTHPFSSDTISVLESQLPHKIVNLKFQLVNVSNKLTISWGS